jgi:predicted DNA-binding helix-hairpin-helix protein
MDLEQKLDILSPAARFDACDNYSQGGRRYRPQRATWSDEGIVAEGGPDGRALPTFRVLMSSKCAWNCPYCPLRSGSDTPRAALSPEELAKLFLPRYERGAVQGLFLSTGVDGDAHAANGQMLDGIEFLRARHGYTGYVHLKLLPGASQAEVERAARLADRLSLNLEAPSAARLARISPERDWAGDLIGPLAWARDWQRAGAHAGTPLLPSGLATQFVVGAAGESDRELLLTTTWLYRELDLRRVYFGAFRPARGTPLEDQPPTPFVREQRLKEADWLLRHYGFTPAELPYDGAGDLPLHVDPKLAWALAHPERFPVELNSADQEVLLRVPGLGPVSVRRIIRLRREHRFRDPAHLKSLGGAVTRIRDFVTLDGRFFGRDAAARARHYAARGPVVEQLTLW